MERKLLYAFRGWIAFVAFMDLGTAFRSYIEKRSFLGDPSDSQYIAGKLVLFIFFIYHLSPLNPFDEYSSLIFVWWFLLLVMVFIECTKQRDNHYLAFLLHFVFISKIDETFLTCFHFYSIHSINVQFIVWIVTHTNSKKKKVIAFHLIVSVQPDLHSFLSCRNLIFGIEIWAPEKS